ATGAQRLIADFKKLPSAATVLEKLIASVVSIAVEGKPVQTSRRPEQCQFCFGPDFPREPTRERPCRGGGSGGLSVA
ncbi:serine endoprotease DegQ, partial [Vibrio parahaemolyticus]|nr:serine endoprotease DegQ [Vibrio parahaemolyticus]